MVIGAVEPAMGAQDSATGMPWRLASCMIRVEAVQSLSGLMANEVMTEMKGVSASASRPPATAAASSITL